VNIIDILFFILMVIFVISNTIKGFVRGVAFFLGLGGGFWLAGLLLVEEAGGMVTDFKGDPYSIYEKEILATNGLIHKAMIDILKIRDLQT